MVLFLFWKNERFFFFLIFHSIFPHYIRNFLLFKNNDVLHDIDSRRYWVGRALSREIGSKKSCVLWDDEAGKYRVEPCFVFILLGEFLSDWISLRNRIYTVLRFIFPPFCRENVHVKTDPSITILIPTIIRRQS